MEHRFKNIHLIIGLFILHCHPKKSLNIFLFLVGSNLNFTLFKANYIYEQKKTQETENKLKHQQKLYEAVRSDRNLYSKNLTETQDEIAEIKLRYKIVMQ